MEERGDEHKLRLVFKGERNYVHGTTMLDETMSLLSAFGYGRLTNVEFVIHKMTGSNLVLLAPGGENGMSTSDDVAVMRLVADGRPLQARIRPCAGAPDRRVPYDEARVVDRCEIDRDARSIRLGQDDSGFTAIEVLVAMTKALHLAVLEKPADASWVFCRWDSPGWPLEKALDGVMVSLRQALGTRLTRSDVELDGQRLGQIYFSAKVAA